MEVIEGAKEEVVKVEVEVAKEEEVVEEHR